MQVAPGVISTLEKVEYNAVVTHYFPPPVCAGVLFKYSPGERLKTAVHA